jgi:hypothetical protein
MRNVILAKAVLKQYRLGLFGCGIICERHHHMPRRTEHAKRSWKIRFRQFFHNICSAPKLAASTRCKWQIVIEGAVEQ